MKKRLPLGTGEEELKAIVEDLQSKLRKKHECLAEARLRLQRAKNNVHRLKGIITYQRERLMKLYQ